MLFTCGFICLLFLSSCIHLSENESKITVGKAFNENLIDKIETNKTTLSEILKWFGAPHHIVRDKGWEVEKLTHTKVGLTPFTAYIDWSDWISGRSLESISEDYIMFIYEFHSSYAKRNAHGVTIFPVITEKSKDYTTIGKDELVIFINKKNKLVENYGFRKEVD
jgi:hypothetical protein